MLSYYYGNPYHLDLAPQTITLRLMSEIPTLLNWIPLIESLVLRSVSVRFASLFATRFPLFRPTCLYSNKFDDALAKAPTLATIEFLS